MGPLGRFSVVALYCLYVASGSPTTAEYGDGDFASLAEEHMRTGPNAAAAGASVVVVEADGSLLARKQEVHPHKISMDVNPEGDGELHHGTLDDDDGGQKHVVIGADGSLAGDGVNEVVVRQKTIHSVEPTADQQAEQQTAEEIAKVQNDAQAVLDADKENATETAKAPAPTPEPEEESDNTAIIIIVLVLLVLCIPAVVVGCLMKHKSEHAPPSALF